ncbi:Nudix family hydrolase [Arhodomonas aquaeolei]|uniref:Nudix family hydrolase n=1 Tax=Arhodomonas aquaeolei TaxID=2369 RepID=UPI0005910850|nr:Nudix family hydrolase [Arhodomonas aquaeolei]
MSPAAETIHVAVAAIRGGDGHVLISRRPDHLHQGGLWEFPGGKVEPGEAVTEALVREIREELDITVTPRRPLIRVPFDYPGRRVELDVWLTVPQPGETPRALEVAEWRWVPSAGLSAYPFPAANTPIVRALTLPERYAITPAEEDGDALLARLDRALASGLALVQWRRATADAALLREAIRRCHASGARLLVNGDPAAARGAGADGVHLSSARLRSLDARPLPADMLVAASCHGPEELDLALGADADFVVLSPVRATPSHPRAHPLGWPRFAEWIAAFPRPVYALGGMSVADLPDALAARAQGIAGIRGLW